jgi:hypothetical protein
LSFDVSAFKNLAKNLPGLDVLDGKLDLFLKSLQLSAPAADGSAFRISADIAKPANTPSVGLNILPGGNKIAGVVDLNSHIELSPKKVSTVNDLRLSMGTDAGSISFATEAALDKDTPAWLQMFGNLKDLKLDIPLRGFVESAFVQKLLNMPLIVDGRLKSDEVKLQASEDLQHKAITIEAGGLKIENLEILRWQSEDLLLDKPEGKFIANFGIKAEMIENALATVALESQLVGSDDFESKSNVKLDLRQPAVDIHNAYLRTSIQRLFQMFPILRTVGLQSKTGKLILSDGTLETIGRPTPNISGKLELKDVEANFSLGEKSPIPLGLVGFQNIGGKLDIALVPLEDSRPQLRIRGQLAPAAGNKPIEFYSPNLGFKAEPIESASVDLSADLAAHNGSRKATLDLKWTTRGKPGFFTVSGVFGESASGKNRLDIEVDLTTSLLNGFKTHYRGIYDIEKKNLVSLSIKLENIRVKALTEPLIALELLPKDFLSSAPDVFLKSLMLSLDESAGKERFFDPKASLDWTMRGEVQLAENAAPALRFFAQLQQQPDPAAWLFGKLNVKVLAPVEWSGWKARLLKDTFSDSISVSGGVKFDAAGAVEITESTEIKVPDLELLPPGSKQWTGIPGTRCTLTAGGMRESEGLSKLRVSGFELQLRDLCSLNSSEAVVQSKVEEGFFGANSSITANLERLSIQNLSRMKELARQLGTSGPLAQLSKLLEPYEIAGSVELTAPKTGETPGISLSTNETQFSGELRLPSLRLKSGTNTLLETANAVTTLFVKNIALKDKPGQMTQFRAGLKLPDGIRCGSDLSLPPEKDGRSNEVTVSGTVQIENGGSKFVLLENDPLKLALSQTRIEINGRTLTLPDLALQCTGAAEQIGAATPSAWRGGNLSFKAASNSLKNFDAKARDNVFLTANIRDATIRPGEFSVAGCDFTIPSLAGVFESLLRPNAAATLPDIKVSGACSISDFSCAFSGIQRALSATIKTKDIDISATGLGKFELHGLNGAVPLFYREGPAPKNWPGVQNYQLSIESAQFNAGSGFNASLPKTSLKFSASPETLTLEDDLQLNVAGAELRLRNFKAQDMLSTQRKANFGIELTADLGQIAKSIGVDPESLGMDLTTREPELRCVIPSCRLLGRPDGDVPWIFQMGEAQPADQPHAAWLSIHARGKPNHHAFYLGNIFIDGLHVPNLLDDSSAWRVGQFTVSDMRFGNLGVLFPLLSTVDLSLNLSLTNVVSEGTTPERFIENVKSFEFAIGTPRAREERPYWNITLTEEMKDRLCKALDLGGFERLVIMGKKSYDFRELGMGIRLKDGLMLCEPKAIDTQRKKYFIRGTGLTDPDLDAGTIGTFNLALPFQGFQNAMLTRAVKLEEFLGRIKTNPKIEEWKKTGLVGENSAGLLEIPAEARFGADETELRSENGIRKAIYQWAAGEFMPPDPTEKDPENYRKTVLTWIQAKAGRLFRDKIVEDSNYKLCWVQHPLTGVWIKAGELRSQLSELYNRELGISKTTRNRQSDDQ